jgi:hypothetical protein
MRDCVARLKSKFSGETPMTLQSRLIPFIGVQRRQESTASFDHVLAKLLSELGHMPTTMGAPLEFERGSLVAAPPKERITSVCVDNGLTLFNLTEPGEWADPAEPARKLARLGIGHPSLILDLLARDVFSALGAVVNVLLLESVDRKTCTLSYVIPSSLIVLDSNPALATAAKDLDRQIESLAQAALEKT